VAARSLTSVRERVRAAVEREASGERRHVAVLAIDGISRAAAAAAWPRAAIEPLCSVFPSTSATAWLSSVSGLDVDDHGVPGVVVSSPDHGLIHVFEYRGPPWWPAPTTIFDDAAARGIRPLALLGDLSNLDCAWRDAVLHGAERVANSPFYAAPMTPRPAALGERLQRELRAAWRSAGGTPCLVWCLLDVDRHIHQRGYDDHVADVLAEIGRVAESLVDEAVVIAHADHGLVPTRHDPELAALLDRVARQEGCALGGAGRTRWLYPRPGGVERLRQALDGRLPPTVTLHEADAFFRPGSLARRRVGELVLIARGDAFLVEEGYTHEHGSLTDAELDVPFATWGA
jgi:hypothetical protein